MLSRITLAFSIVVTCLSITSCTDEGASRKALQNEGYTDITFTGYSYFICGEGDSYSTGFKAKNPKGVQVKGTVCCGTFKGCTVRW